MAVCNFVFLLLFFRFLLSFIYIPILCVITLLSSLLSVLFLPLPSPRHLWFWSSSYWPYLPSRYCYFARCLPVVLFCLFLGCCWVSFYLRSLLHNVKCPVMTANKTELNKICWKNTLEVFFHYCTATEIFHCEVFLYSCITPMICWEFFQGAPCFSHSQYRGSNPTLQIYTLTSWKIALFCAIDMQAYHYFLTT